MRAPCLCLREEFSSMLGKTHLCGGLAVAALICSAGGLTAGQGMGCTAGCAFGSLFPDIDHKGSMLGQKVKPVSSVIGAVAGHRTLFHWFAPYLLLACVLHIGFPGWDMVTLSVLAGILSHLFLDALTPSGVPLYPGRKAHLLKIHTGSGIDKALGICLAVLAAGGFLKWAISIFRGF